MLNLRTTKALGIDIPQSRCDRRNDGTAGRAIFCGRGWTRSSTWTAPLVKLSRTIDWSFLEQQFGAVYEDKPGRPPLPTRLMVGLAILKHTYDLSDELLCERWVENPYYQFVCGEEFFQHRLAFDRSSLTRWRQRMGEDRLQALLQESLSAASKTEAIKPSDLNRVIVDTTVQPRRVLTVIGYLNFGKALSRRRNSGTISCSRAGWMVSAPTCVPRVRVDCREMDGPVHLIARVSPWLIKAGGGLSRIR
jgi:hypothetical protein